MKSLENRPTNLNDHRRASVVDEGSHFLLFPRIKSEKNS